MKTVKAQPTVTGSMQVKGTLILKLKKEDGSTVVAKHKNLVMYEGGLRNIAGYIATGQSMAGVSSVGYFALGNDGTPPDEHDTQLIGELRRDPAMVTVQGYPEENKIEVKVEHVLGEVSGTFEEAGLFNSSYNGDMFNRTTFAPFVVTTADTLTTVWVIEVINV